MSNAFIKLSNLVNKYTVFEQDQVLTAEQLNSITGYLETQTRLTRVKLFGIGIASGLEVSFSENSVTIKKGCAISSDGDLLSYGEDMVFNYFREFNDIRANYPLFKADDVQIKLYELLTEVGDPGMDMSLEDFSATSGYEIINTAVVLYLESYENDPDICTGGECDNLGKERINNLRALLVSLPDLANLSKAPATMGRQYFSLAENIPDRILLTPENIVNYNDLGDLYNTMINNLTTQLLQLLQNSYQACLPLLQDTYGESNPVDNWRSIITNKLSELNSLNNVGIQYFYDFLKDIFSTYNEFVEELFDTDTVCCPDVTLFPKHVILGSFVSPPLFDLYRHRFYESPILNNKQENLRRAVFLHKRIDLMIKSFDIPKGENAIKIIPSKSYESPLGERAIPYYYQIGALLLVAPQYLGTGIPSITTNITALRTADEVPTTLHGYLDVPGYPYYSRQFFQQRLSDNWNYELYRRLKSYKIYSYNANQYSQYQPALQPLNYSIDKYPFFRIEGHLGRNIEEAEVELRHLVAQYNIPVKILSLQIEEDITQVIPRPGFWLGDLKAIHSLVRKDIFQNLRNVQHFNSRVKTQYSDKNNIGSLMELHVNLGNSIQQISGMLQSNFASFEPVQFETNYLGMVNYAGQINQSIKDRTYTSAFTPFEGLLNDLKFGWLNFLSEIINKREEKSKELSIFSNFLKKHSGMEHMAGVRTGGTFILVYSSETKNIVADFSLPYLYCESINELEEDEAEEPAQISTIDWATLNIFNENPLFIREDDFIFQLTSNQNAIFELIDPKIANVINPLLQPINTQIELHGQQLGDINLYKDFYKSTFETYTQQFGSLVQNATATYDTIMSTIKANFVPQTASTALYNPYVIDPNTGLATFGQIVATTTPFYNTALLSSPDPEIRYAYGTLLTINNLINQINSKGTLTPADIAIKDSLEATEGIIIAGTLNAIAAKEADIQPGSTEQLFITEASRVTTNLTNINTQNSLAQTIKTINENNLSKTNLTNTLNNFSIVNRAL